MESDPRSSNGRMAASDAADEGSTPSLGVKKCGRCEVKKSLSAFGKRGTGLQPWCRLCKQKWDREHYANTKTDRRKQIRERDDRTRDEARLLVTEYFHQHPCVDCGESDIVVLEFDHLGEKEFNIAEGLSGGYSLRRLQTEIKKCESVCCNCHRRRTSVRNNSWRLGL